MKHRFLVPAFVIFSALATVSCNRKDEAPPVIPEPIGGKGGNATLRVTPQHHAKVIDSCTVYIKYNASDASATYDDSVACVMVGGKPVASFTDLKAGKYYLMGRGYDTSIRQAVRGGIPYEVTQEQTIDITLPVTEDH